MIVFTIILILLAILSRQWGGSMLLKASGALMIAGMILFSGSIYAEILGAPEALGQVAPIGGQSFMLAWVLVALAAFLTPKTD